MHAVSNTLDQRQEGLRVLSLLDGIGLALVTLKNLNCPVVSVCLANIMSSLINHIEC